MVIVTGALPSTMPEAISVVAFRLPLESTVAADDGVCDAWPPPPVTMLVLTRAAAEVTQVAQAIVPVVVIVPPVIGEVVAMLVTVPVPGAPPSTRLPPESIPATCPVVSDPEIVGTRLQIDEL